MTEQRGRGAAHCAWRDPGGNLELLAKLLSELDDRPQVKLLVSPEWLELRAVIVAALEPYSEARGAVLRAIEGAGNGVDLRRTSGAPSTALSSLVP